jgi:hypothetical protein
MMAYTLPGYAASATSVAEGTAAPWGVRVIEAEDLEAARPPVTACVDVILRVDDEPRRRRRSHIARAPRLHDLIAAAEEDTAALSRKLLARVRDQPVSNVARRRHVSLET